MENEEQMVYDYNMAMLAIALSTGEPMKLEEGSTIAVFNGVIYKAKPVYNRLVCSNRMVDEIQKGRKN